MMGRNGCRKRYHQVDDPILSEYFEFTGIVRDLPEAPIGPVWKEKPTKGTFVVFPKFIPSYMLFNSPKF